MGQDNVEYKVIQVEVDANVVALIAFNEFTPKATIPGFTIVKSALIWQAEIQMVTALIMLNFMVLQKELKI